MLEVEQRPELRAAEDETYVEARRPVEEPLSRSIDLGRYGVELLAWGGVIILAAALRLLALGSDALSAEGSRHAFAAFSLYKGSGELLDAVAGGPFAVVFSALLFFLFGVTDEIARLGPALAGVGTVVAAIWLRPYLGRSGAIFSGLMLAVSPSLVYFARRDQPDAYATFFGTVLFVAILRLFDRGRRADFILAAVAAALLFVSTPLGITTLLIIAVAALVVAFRPAASSADGEEDEEDAEVLVVGEPFGRANFAAAARAGALPAALAAVATLILVFSAFGAAPGNLVDGPGAWLLAWTESIAPVGDNLPGRGPGFALALLPLYEPLALVAGIWGAVNLFTGRGRPSPRGGVEARTMLAVWAVIGAILLLIGGAQQPELIVLVAFPLSILAGVTLGRLVEAIDWRREGSFWTGGALVLLFTFLALTAWGSSLGNLLQENALYDQTTKTFRFLLTLIGFALPLTAAAIWFGRRIERGAAVRALALGLAIFLLGFTLRSGVGLGIYRPDVPSEPMVYGASTPEVGPLMDRVLALSRDETALQRTPADITGGHGLVVWVDPAVEWPVRWYLRDFPGLTIAPIGGVAAQGQALPQIYFRPADGSPAPPLGYTEQEYKLRWSYPADQPLMGGSNNALLQVLGFWIFRNNVAPAPSVNLLVGYGPSLAERLFLPPPATGPFGLNERPGRGKAQGQLDSPRGAAIAPDGSIYVVDMMNARVQQYAPDGSFVRTFGSLGHGDGQLWRESNRGPTGIAIDAEGNVYVADTWNYRIVKFTADGTFVTTWGTYANIVSEPPVGDPREGLFGPRGIAIGQNGDIFVTDTGNGRVVVYGPDGTYRREFGSKGIAPGQLDEPVGIAVSEDGSRVYVADSNNARIAVFDGQGAPVARWAVAAWEGQTFYEPYLALDAEGNVYATSMPTRQVLKFNSEGTLVGVGSTGISQEDAFAAPYGIAIAPDNVIYVVDGNRHAVIKMEPLTGP